MDELLKALEVLKNECNKHGTCTTCPFREDTETLCYIKNHVPSSWRIDKGVIYPKVFIQ